MSTITKQWLQQKIAEMEAARDEIPFGLDEDDSNTLAALRIALASLEAEPVAFINGAREPVLYRAHIGIAIATQLYTSPPAQMLEIENLEHFISFWKKVQAGQMKPGKNDIDHMVWFLEGLSNLTAPPAPVSVPEPIKRNDADGWWMYKGRRVGGGCAEWYNLALDDCRAAMLQGGKS